MRKGDSFNPNRYSKLLLSAESYDLKKDKRLLIPFTNGRKIGFINRAGIVQSAPVYSMYYGDCYSEYDYIRVEKFNAEWRAYNQGNSFQFLMGIIDYKGNEIYPCEYKSIIPALGNYKYLFTFENQSGKYAVMTAGKRIIVDYSKYDWIDGFDKGLARVKIGKVTNGLKQSKVKWGIIDVKGHEVLPVEYDDIESFYGKENKYSVCIKKDNNEKVVTLSSLILNYQHYLKHRNSPNESYKDFNTFEEYEGTYAQREMGFSDEEIEDAFDGDPDAVWNID